MQGERARERAPTRGGRFYVGGFFEPRGAQTRQDAPKRAKTHPRRPKMRQEALKTGQRRPKRPPRRAKTRPRRPKTRPRRSQDAQDASKTPQDAPRSIFGCQNGGKLAPCWPPKSKSTSKGDFLKKPRFSNGKTIILRVPGVEVEAKNRSKNRSKIEVLLGRPHFLDVHGFWFIFEAKLAPCWGPS